MKDYKPAQNDRLEKILKTYLADYPTTSEHIRNSYSYMIHNWIENLENGLKQRNSAYLTNQEATFKEILGATGLDVSGLVRLQNSQDGDTNDIPQHQIRYPLSEHTYFAYFPPAIWRKVLVEFHVAKIPLEKATVCDLGVGPGVILSTVLKLKPNWKGFGLDINESCVNYARKFLEWKGIKNVDSITQASIVDIPYANGTFDVVTATEVFEHILNPIEGLSEAARILKPSGYLVSSIPVRFPMRDHLYVFQTEAEVVQLYESSGFTIKAFEKQEFQLPGMPYIATFAVAIKNA